MRVCMLPTTAGRAGQACLTARPRPMRQRLAAARQQLPAGALWRAGSGGSRRQAPSPAAAAGGSEAEPSSSGSNASSSNERTSSSSSNASMPGSSGRGSSEPVPMRSLLEASSSSLGSPPPDKEPHRPVPEGRGVGARLLRAAAAVLRMLRSPLALRRLLTIAFMFTLGSVMSLASSRGRSVSAPQEVGGWVGRSLPGWLLNRPAPPESHCQAWPLATHVNEFPPLPMRTPCLPACSCCTASSCPWCAAATCGPAASRRAAPASPLTCAHTPATPQRRRLARHRWQVRTLARGCEAWQRCWLLHDHGI